MTIPTSAAEIREFLKIPENAASSSAVQEILDATLETVRSKVTVSLSGDLVTYRPSPKSTGALMIPSGAAELVSITDPAGRDVDVDDLEVDLDAGIIWPLGTWRTASPWTVVVQRPGAGAAVALAVKIIAKHLWGVHRGDGGHPGAHAQDGAALVGYAIPRRAQELLEPFTLTGFA